MNIDQVFSKHTVWQMHPPKAATISTGTPVGEASRLMREKRIGCVTVVLNRKVIGVFTERDLIKKVLCSKVDLTQPVDQFMTANPDFLQKNDPVGKAIRMMNSNVYRHLPVVDEDGNLVALFSVRLILNFLAEYFHTEILNLPPSPNQVILHREGG